MSSMQIFRTFRSWTEDSLTNFHPTTTKILQLTVNYCERSKGNLERLLAAVLTTEKITAPKYQSGNINKIFPSVLPSASCLTLKSRAKNAFVDPDLFGNLTSVMTKASPALSSLIPSLVNVSRNTFFSSRCEKNIFFSVDIVVKNRFICVLSWSVLLSTTTTCHCSSPKHFFLLFLHFERVCKRFWEESLTRRSSHLHNAPRALPSLSRCLQLSANLDSYFFRYL